MNGFRPHNNLKMFFLEPISVKTSWRNGSASDSTSEGCVFESHRGPGVKFLGTQFHSQAFGSTSVSDINDFGPHNNLIVFWNQSLSRFRGAMVARLTPDQKVACSNQVEVMKFYF